MATLRPTSKVSTNHKACIHHIAHDYYGKRVATCSSDKSIKVFEKDDDGNWHPICQSFGYPGHRAAIWKVEWAHPEFGQVLASCSDDRTVIIWKEKEMVGSGQQGPTKMQFVEAKKLTDFTKGVSSIAFGPSHLGLQIASACNDGKVRIHQGRATDLSQWDLKSEFEPEGSGIGAYVTCLSWNQNRSEKPMLVVGSWRVTAAPDQNGSRPVTSTVTVWGLITERWAQVARLEIEGVGVGKGVGSEVRDVDWAPSMGRPNYFIAAAVGATVQVWRLDPQQCQLTSTGHVEKPSSVLSAQSEDHPSVNMALWRVSWNLTGTCLAVSAENGQVKMWKLDFQGNLKPHLTLDPQA